MVKKVSIYDELRFILRTSKTFAGIKVAIAARVEANERTGEIFEGGDDSPRERVQRISNIAREETFKSGWKEAAALGLVRSERVYSRGQQLPARCYVVLSVWASGAETIRYENRSRGASGAETAPSSGSESAPEVGAETAPDLYIPAPSTAKYTAQESTSGAETALDEAGEDDKKRLPETRQIDSETNHPPTSFGLHPKEKTHPPTPSRDFRAEVKAAFNGSTERAITKVREWSRIGEPGAVEWLAHSLEIYGEALVKTFPAASARGPGFGLQAWCREAGRQKAWDAENAAKPRKGGAERPKGGGFF